MGLTLRRILAHGKPFEHCLGYGDPLMGARQQRLTETALELQ